MSFCEQFLLISCFIIFLSYPGKDTLQLPGTVHEPCIQRMLTVPVPFVLGEDV